MTPTITPRLRFGWARFELTLQVPLSPEETWARIVDVTAHGRVVPFTTGVGPAPVDVVTGSRLIARTALGPIGFDDVMTVSSCEPARYVQFVKVGKVLGGRIAVEWASVDGAWGESTHVRWQQTVEFPWARRLPNALARTAAAIGAPALALGYRHYLPRVLAVGGFGEEA